MNARTVRKLAAAGMLAFTASASQAAIVENWDFVLDMKWNTGKTVFKQSEFEPGVYNITKWYKDGKKRTAFLDRGRTENTATRLSWGSDLSGARLRHPDPLYARSGLVIEKPHETGNIATTIVGETPIITSANMFTHYNGEISGIADTLKRAQIDLTIQLMLPDHGNVVKNIAKSFEVHFFETMNYGHTGCSYSNNCDEDIFAVISGMDLTDTFTYGGVKYTLSYFEAPDDKKLKLLSDTTCKTMGFATGSCYGFTTREHEKTDVLFNFTISAVPEPETYTMLLAGLGIVGFVARRRRN